jgi:hypothetical protein
MPFLRPSWWSAQYRSICTIFMEQLGPHHAVAQAASLLYTIPAKLLDYRPKLR